MNQRTVHVFFPSAQKSAQNNSGCSPVKYNGCTKAGKRKKRVCWYTVQWGYAVSFASGVRVSQCSPEPWSLRPQWMLASASFIYYHWDLFLLFLQTESIWFLLCGLFTYHFLSCLNVILTYISSMWTIFLWCSLLWCSDLLKFLFY